MATGAATVYLPHGRYTIDDGIAIPPTLRRFVGMNASITVRPERQPSFARDTGMFRIDQAGPPLVIERLAFDMTDLGDQLAVQVSAQRDVTLRDIVTAGTSLLDRERRAAGACSSRTSAAAACTSPDPARSMPASSIPRAANVRIVNDGSPLAILGLKTEGVCTVLENRNGARSVIHGGLLYMVRDADPQVPAFINADGSLLATFVEESSPLRQPLCRLPARSAARGARGGISGARLRPDRALANSRPLMAGCRDMDRPPGSPAVVVDSTQTPCCCVASRLQLARST